MGRPRKRMTPNQSDLNPIDSSKSKRAKEAEPEPEPEEELLNQQKRRTQKNIPDSELSLVGPPVPASEALKRWPSRYSNSSKVSSSKKKGTYRGSKEEGEVLQAKCHYTMAMVDGCVYNLGDSAYVKADEGDLDYIARIVELFESTDGEPYFSAQWFYRAKDTVIKDHEDLIDKKRVFLSDIRDDNPLNCIVSKIKIAKVGANIDLEAKEKKIPPCDLYYDMKYSLPYLTFSNIINETNGGDNDTSSTISSESDSNNVPVVPEMRLLDLYSGCGAMSTGLCIGASLSGVKLVTGWAVDINPHACKSLKKNHPGTQVRNEAAEDFLSLLKEWPILCKKYAQGKELDQSPDLVTEVEEEEEGEEGEEKGEEKGEEGENDNNEDSSVSDGEFEVEKLLAICYGDPNKVKKSGVYFKVRWMGYGPKYDTWEPIDGLSDCQEKVKEFVTKGYRSNILPFPGDVDVICGGPPCQGISGFNRFRNPEAPLEDVKNRQLVVYMNIIDYLKPKYVLMENVVDILKFAGGFLGRYAIGRLVSMNYQARLGMMAAGSYGLPQFRMRVFLWGAQPSKASRHFDIGKGGVPNEFEEITVAYAKNQPCELEKALSLGDAISDLPQVNNDAKEDERTYGTTARTEFQKFIRLKRNNVVSLATAQIASRPGLLYDHRPLELNADDFERVCHIPKKKGANFRDLAGVLVGDDNKVKWDPSVERVLLKSGKPLVPDYAMTFVRGTSPKYIQVGNAVAVPVGIALGYTFGLACQGLSGDQPLTKLPFKFPNCLSQSSSALVVDIDDSD
ncbi:hypothetical protein EZV62_020414 [Acer yangbiense]|uniref:DNA (cytosine-5-)-methyltransferase n=1 Tax=Acer yangbiense TaxID=1000413 RepID=A0A5C7HEF4_9ROSI|nr:hypothetical protein EZV62_020414 [Acer yangbiense]